MQQVYAAAHRQPPAHS